MSSVIDSIERRQLRQGLPSFDPGDRVRVHFQVIEGSRRRTQVFEGVVLRRQGSGVRETFTVRKQSFGVGVERTFPLHSPKIEKLEIAARGDVRRAKLYYLRGRIGKAARVAERRWGIDEDLVSTPTAAAEPAAVDADGATIEETEATQTPEGAEVEAAKGAEAVEPAAAETESTASAEEDSQDAEAAPEAEASEDAPSPEEPEPAAEAEVEQSEPAAEAEPEAEEAEVESGPDAGSEEPEAEGAGDDAAEEPADSDGDKA